VDGLLIEHVDSIIQIVLGAVFSWLGYQRPSRLGARATKALKICGPALVVIGAALLFKPAAPLQWQRQSTSDGTASAEFPGTPKRQEVTDTVGAVSVQRTTFSFNVPGKDIALFLSSSPLPEGALGMTDEQRLDSTLAYLISQGSRLLSKEQSGSIFRMTIRDDAKKGTTQMALAYIGDHVYRAVAAWTDGQENPALTDRFVKSFQISAAH
jgi:hypothetical protein